MHALGANPHQAEISTSSIQDLGERHQSTSLLTDVVTTRGLLLQVTRLFMLQAHAQAQAHASASGAQPASSQRAIERAWARVEASVELQDHEADPGRGRPRARLTILRQAQQWCLATNQRLERIIASIEDRAPCSTSSRRMCPRAPTRCSAPRESPRDACRQRTAPVVPSHARP